MMEKEKILNNGKQWTMTVKYGRLKNKRRKKSKTDVKGLL